jgi:hypothetical protein
MRSNHCYKRKSSWLKKYLSAFCTTITGMSSRDKWMVFTRVKFPILRHNERVKDLKLIFDRKFMIGFQVCWLIFIIKGFLEGETDWKKAMFWGSVAILMIGIDKMLLEKEGH